MAKDSPQLGNAKKKAQHAGGGGSSSVKREVDETVNVKREGGQDGVPKGKLKPGQKVYPTPTPGGPQRVFYETLLKQKPESHMAQDWCLANGVLGVAEAEALYKQVCKRRGLQPSAMSNSPMKKPKPSSGGGKGKQRSRLPKEIEADTGFEPTGVYEGVGTTGF